MIAEHYAGNLWVVRGRMDEAFAPVGISTVLLPGYINRAVHPITAAFAEMSPPLARAMEITESKLRGVACCYFENVVDGNIRYAIHYSSYYTPYGDVPCDLCPPERWWAKVLNRTKFPHDSIHWAETDPLANHLGAVSRMLWGMINTRRLKFYYYNPDWNVAVSRRIDDELVSW